MRERGNHIQANKELGAVGRRPDVVTSLRACSVPPHVLLALHTYYHTSLSRTCEAAVIIILTLLMRK